MLKVGLTGSFGMGKSAAGAAFKELGAYVIDTDAIVRDLFNEHRVQQALIELFGKTIAPAGTIDKGIISRIVFSNRKIKTRLEDLLHPFVFERVNAEISAHRDVRIFIIEAPILYERGYECLFDYIINVQCPIETTLRRLINRGYNKEDVMARLNAQMPSHIKSERADFVIDNDKDLEHLKNQVRKIYNSLERMADDPNQRSTKKTEN